MAVNSSAATSMEPSMGMASSHGQMETNMKESLSKTGLKERVGRSGPMAASTKVSGPTIRCMARANRHGLMAKATKANTTRTKKMAMGNTHGKYHILCQLVNVCSI